MDKHGVSCQSDLRFESCGNLFLTLSYCIVHGMKANQSRLGLVLLPYEIRIFKIMS